MLRRLVLVASAGLLAIACGASEPEAPPPPPDLCTGDTVLLYDPLSGSDFETFPDDFLTRDDPNSPTGLRGNVSPETSPWVEGMSDIFRDSFYKLSQLSGFGTNGPIVLRFSAPLGALPSGESDSLNSEAIALFEFPDGGPASRVPFEAALIDEDTAIQVWPMRPLRPKTLHALVVTTAQDDAEGSCLRASPTLRTLLDGMPKEPLLARLRPRYVRLLEETGLHPNSISGATVFTTHGELDLLIAAAEDAQQQDAHWVSEPTCSEHEEYRECVLHVQTRDYRDGPSVLDASAGEAWEIPVTVWLPKAGEGPYPTVLFGHGINGERSSGHTLASVLAPYGFAVIAMDALHHGEHPTADEDSGNDAVTFLGVNLAALSLEAFAMRGNFNQTILDRLQLIEAIRTEPDVDDMPGADLDINRLGYYGVSLGGMMGPPLTALSDDIQAAVFAVAGGRLLSLAVDSPNFKPFKPLVLQLVGSEGLFERSLAMAQTLVDAADPATWAPYVINQRVRPASRIPHVLFTVALNDDTVPPVAGRALARALGTPHVGTVHEDVGLIPLEDNMPVVGNRAEGLATAGFFQFDRISQNDTAIEATHGNVPFSPEGSEQTLHFFETWVSDLSEIVDPYVILNTPQIP